MENILQIDPDFYLYKYKDIVKTKDGYKLQPVFERLENGDIVMTKCSRMMKNQNSLDKDCAACIHSSKHRNTYLCTLRMKLDEYPNFLRTIDYVHNCDAYEYIEPLTVIRSEEEMIQFIEKTEKFFPCPEEYESYYGFERKWDEETGEILETVGEYYNRGGKFEYFPNKYPCVIYFGLVDDGYWYSWSSAHPKWVYCGE